MKKYKIIYADPPWSYPHRKADTKFGIGVTSHYPTMSVEEISKLNVKDIADENCILFIWTTFPYLLPSKSMKGSVIDVIENWGFKYTTVGFVWVKENPVNGGIFAGPGNYTKSNAEVCLIATKGKLLERADKTIKQIVISAREQHSKKPDEVRRRIEQMYGDVPRIELFARQKNIGWDIWGNELENDIELL